MKYNPFDDDMLKTKIPLRALLVPGCLIGIQIMASLLYIFVSDLTLKSFVLFGVGTSLIVTLFAARLCRSCKKVDTPDKAIEISGLVLLPIKWFITYAIVTSLMMHMLRGSILPFAN